MDEIIARYFDGAIARAHRVGLRREGDVLSIRSESGAELARWPIADLRTAGDPREDGAAFVTCEGWSQARLVLDSAEARAAFAALAPALKRLRPPRRRSLRSWAGMSLAAAAVIAAVVLAVDRLPDWLAPLVPQRWEAWLGDRVIDGMADRGYCREPKAVAALAGLAQRLSAAGGIEPPVEVRVIEWKQVNAFAVPGGRIAILSGLVDKAEDANELAGVLAHEMGHVLHHDPTEGLLRQLGLAATIQLLVGGSASGIEDAAGLGQMLLTLRYSRRAETDADAAALMLLQRAGIDGHGLNRFFVRMEKADKAGGFVPTLLLTHPPTAERLAATAKAADGAPALSEAQWQALKQICKD
jgi:predicted Zn-dependent protease